MSFGVHSASVGFRRVVSVAGDVDLATAATLQEAVDAVLHSCERDIWIDLTDVRFIDSSGLHVLIHANRMLRLDHRRLAIIAPPGPARRVLELTQLDGLLPLFADRAGAHCLS